MGKVTVVTGGQFGSEAKGHVCEWLARKNLRETSTQLVSARVGGPNAGHTVYPGQVRGEEGVALRQLPVASLVDPNAISVISRRSILDLDVLHAEVALVDEFWGKPDGLQLEQRLLVDDQNTIIEPRHRNAEQAIGTGTTGKGIGAARADRVLRNGVQQYKGPYAYQRTGDAIRAQLQAGSHLLLEGTQGYGLGSHAGYYPFVTSGDCTALDWLSHVGVSPWADEVDELEVWVVFRTYPIRIAGNSGPLFYETTFDALGQKTEYTTVTKKPRRIGMWDRELFERSMADNGASPETPNVKVALSFVDYLAPELFECDDPNYLMGHDGFAKWCKNNLGFFPDMVCTGPRTEVELR